jgi:hypothetical protein
MMRKFAVALIATTMLVAPALAADTSTRAAAATTPAVTPAPSTATKTAIKTKTHKIIKIAHRHQVHHMAFAKNGKHPSHAKTAKLSKPLKSVTASATPTSGPAAATTPASGTATPAVSTVSQPAKTIKASGGSKKIKLAHRHNEHHLAMAKTSKHASVKHASVKRASHAKIAKVSKPVKNANLPKAHKQVAHVVKNPKVIAN